MFSPQLKKQPWFVYHCGFGFSWFKSGQFEKIIYHHQDGILSFPL
jgi:hypothetical protein